MRKPYNLPNDFGGLHTSLFLWGSEDNDNLDRIRERVRRMTIDEVEDYMTYLIFYQLKELIVVDEQ